MIDKTKTVCNIACLILLSAFNLTAQLEGLHGDFLEKRMGLHTGNMFHISFYNDGMFGGFDKPGEIGGEWLGAPVAGALYLLDGNVHILGEVLDEDGVLQHIMSTSPGPTPPIPNQINSGNFSPTGEWWTFLPLPGFANPDTNLAAMNKWTISWPPQWPDKMDDPVDPGWAGSWNGYFGKNQFNADEESYFVVDDYEMREFKFFPDSTDRNRQGLGLRMYTRGFQWSNALVEDGIFILFDIENIGTYIHDKLVFTYKIGNNMGDLNGPTDTNDDNGAYDLEEDIAYMWDNDDIGTGGYTPVGFLGASLLESPGNARDGIDNDADGLAGSGKILAESDFTPHTLESGESIILIDYKTFDRTQSTMSNDTLYVNYLDQIIKFWPGKQLEEKPHNLIDDNLNGLIDENNGSVFGTPPDEIRRYLYVGNRVVDYFSDEGLDNPLIDERRDDGIDNDEDWNFSKDDLGQDGAPYTNDPGENDGMATLGEPHFDKTDIDETDMIGLTSFSLFHWEDLPRDQDELFWQASKPGYLDDILQNDNVDLLWGSGYFPMKPGDIERFSMGFVLGSNFDDMTTNKFWFEKAYSENYNFAKAPDVPTLTAIPGDSKVTLLWDDIAEQTEDPILGRDFEGYRIYRSTDPYWKDMISITDGQGNTTFRKPLAQFDLDNEFEGYAAAPIKGIQFWLGTNSGLVHHFEDTTVTNGITYYYALTSYDHGDPESGLPPSECTKYILVNESFEIQEKGPNVQKVRPEAPPAGYVAANYGDIQLAESYTSDGFVQVNILNPEDLKDNHQYRVTFNEGITRRTTPITESFNFMDITTGDTLLKESPLFHDGDELPVFDGFQLSFHGSLEILEFASSSWNQENILQVRVKEHSTYRDNGVVPQNSDYILVTGEVGMDTSVAFPPWKPSTLPSVPVNFQIIDKKLNKKMKFAFNDKDQVAGQEGILSSGTSSPNSRDAVIILSDSLIPGWELALYPIEPETLMYQPGDTAFLNFRNPFLSGDSLTFTIHAPAIDNERAQTDLDLIRVVPNPYVVTADWEPLNPYTRGRGPRELHFINLPAQCTIRIFNISGLLVQEIDHQALSDADGTAVWDMLSKDRLEVSYGIYIYHIDAGELGSKIGKFAIIK